MSRKLLQQPSREQLLEAAHELAPSADESLLVLLAENGPMDIQAVQQALAETSYSFFGGLFPGLIYQQQKLEGAVILLKLSVECQPFLIQDLAWDAASLDCPKSRPHRNGMIILLDGLMRGVSEYLEMINDQLGAQYSFIGGGAGSLTLVQQPCLMTREGVFQDAALGCLLKQKVRLGIRHGWQRLAGPFLVTEAEGNNVKKLNWRPALDVYREVVEEDANIRLGIDNFFEHAKGYPFGMIREQEEDIVRDPISTNEDGVLLCVGEVPENSAVYILKGRSTQLIDAARQAFEDCQGGEKTTTEDHLLVVDCISRTLFLEEEFSSELGELQNGGTPPVGILSLGEIASFGAGALEFFNKTIVLGQLQST